MKAKANVLIGMLLTMAIVIPLISCQNKENAALFVGSLDTEGFSMDMPVFQSLQEMIQESQIILIGKRSGDPELVTGEIMTNTIFDISVERVIKGEPTLSPKFFQLGTDTTDDYETKLKEGKSYLLFLTENFIRDVENDESEVIYNSISFEQGIFEVSKSGTLIPYSRIGASHEVAKQSLSDLSKSIAK